MKWLILLFIIAVAVVLIGVRYRRQLQTGIYLWRMFRKLRQAGTAEKKQVETKANIKDSPLVRCARCGTWTAQANALGLRNRVFYCSAACMENAVKVG